MSEPADPLPQSPAGADAAEDVALMLRVKTGDLAAFEALVDRHQAAVIGTVAKMLDDPAEAEDIAQQVFVRIWQAAVRYEPSAKFSTWMFTIARNLVFNEMRRRKRRSESSLEERDEAFHQGLHDPSATAPDVVSQQVELEAAVSQAIHELPEKQRLAVVLRRYENMPYEEIGAVIGLSLPAVKSLLFRARAQLKEALREFLD